VVIRRKYIGARDHDFAAGGYTQAYASYQYDPAQAHGGQMVNGTLVMPAPGAGAEPGAGPGK
jgi:hypothetical protein